jgi:hypothetical protein
MSETWDLYAYGDKQRNIKESRDAAQCNYSGHAKPGTTILHTQLQAAAEVQGWLQTMQGQRHISSAYVSVMKQQRQVGSVP